MWFLRSALAIMTAALVVTATSGCIDYREQISFNADGSGEVVGHLFIPNTTLDLLVSGTDSALYRATVDRIDHDAITERIRAEGVTIRRAESAGTDSGIVVSIEYAFSDLEAFRRTRGNGRDVALSEVDGVYELTLMFSGDASGVGHTTSTDEIDDETEPEIVITAPNTADFESLLSGFRVAFDIRVPTQVVSAPGGRFRDDAAHFAWSFEREGRTVLEPKTMRVIFRKGELIWPTFEAIPYDRIEDGQFYDAWNNGY